MRVRELVAGGMSEAAARAEAERRFGDLAAVGAECRRLAAERDRTMRRAERFADVGQDVRYALRQLARARGFTAAAVLTLALGIGATTAIFGVVDAVLLAPLPYPAADRLVMPQSFHRQSPGPRAVGLADYEDWRAAEVFEAVALHRPRNVNVVGVGEAERVPAAEVTEDFFAVIGAAPVLGSVFHSADHEPGAPRRVVLSYGLWQRRFGGERDVIGRTVRVAGEAHEIAAVLPADMGYPASAELWLPQQLTPEDRASYLRRDNFVFFSIARLRSGRTLEETRALLAGLARRAAETEPVTRGEITISAAPLAEVLVGERTARTLWLLLGAVGCVLLVGCVNVANLLLGRSAARRSELAIRAGLGASRLRLVRQLLTESLVLALLGGAAGVLLAFWGVRALVALAPASLPRIESVALDPVVLLFALGVSLLSAVLFGLAPALSTARRGAHALLTRGTGRATAGTGARRGRTLLVAAELALSLVLLVGAGLLLRSFVALRATDPGFELAGLVTFSLSLQGERYAERPDRPAQFAAFFERLEAVPGVTRVAAVSSLPLGGGGGYLGRVFLAEGRPEPPAGAELDALWVVATPGYFATMGLPLLAGRDFTAADRADAPPVAIVSRSFARRMFPDGDALGQRVRSWRDENVYREIVGIVEDVRSFGVADEVRPVFYVPYPQDAWNALVVVARTGLDRSAALPAVRAALRDFDPELAVASVNTMDRVFDDSVAPSRFVAFLLGIFAAVSLVLAAVGIYGVISFGVAQRHREIGIRMALGARRADVLRMILREAGTVVAAGLLLGIAAALGLARLLGSLLHDVAPNDPLTFAAVVLLLGAVALAASWLPGRRAAAVEPMRSLRAE